ncbi:hypothetical protein [Planifilum fimeticola]
MANFIDQLNTIREQAETETWELIQVISNNERLYGEFPAMKKVFIDAFRQLEIETLKLQPTTQQEFRLKNYLASILQDLQGATQGLYVSIFTTSNFHENWEETARFFKATIRGTLKRFNYLSNEMKRQVFSPVLKVDQDSLIEDDTGEEEFGIGIQHVDIGDADALFIDDMFEEGVDVYAP